jgi:hypothetical protein
VRNNAGLERIESIGVAKKVGDVNQEIAKEVSNLDGILSNSFDVSVERIKLKNLHPSVHAAKKGFCLVARELVTGLLPQNVIDGFLRRPHAVIAAFVRVLIVAQVEAPGELDELSSHLFGGYR